MATAEKEKCSEIHWCKRIYMYLYILSANTEDTAFNMYAWTPEFKKLSLFRNVLSFYFYHFAFNMFVYFIINMFYSRRICDIY